MQALGLLGYVLGTLEYANIQYTGLVLIIVQCFMYVSAHVLGYTSVNGGGGVMHATLATVAMTELLDSPRQTLRISEYWLSLWQSHHTTYSTKRNTILLVEISD